MNAIFQIEDLADLLDRERPRQVRHNTAMACVCICAWGLGCYGIASGVANLAHLLCL